MEQMTEAAPTTFQGVSPVASPPRHPQSGIVLDSLGDYAPVMTPFRLLRRAAAHQTARLHALGTARAIRVIEEEFV